MIHMKKILVVDDSDVVRRILTMNLEQNGYEVIEAGNGQEALSLLGKHTFFFVFADLHMPVLNGLQLLKRIRMRFNAAELPFVMLTALGEEEEKAEAESYGVNEFITKPASSHHLLATIKRHTRLSNLSS